MTYTREQIASMPPDAIAALAGCTKAERLDQAVIKVATWVALQVTDPPTPAAS